MIDHRNEIKPLSSLPNTILNGLQNSFNLLLTVINAGPCPKLSSICCSGDTGYQPWMDLHLTSSKQTESKFDSYRMRLPDMTVISGCCKKSWEERLCDEGIDDILPGLRELIDMSAEACHHRRGRI